MVIIGMTSRAAAGLGAGWPVDHAGAILGNLLGVGVALKLRARITAYVLGVTAIAQLAEYPTHLWFGINTVQGGATKLALILAAGLGLGFSFLVRRRARSSAVVAEAIDVNAEKPQADSRTQAEQSRALALRPI
jgi:glucokinase